MSASTLPWAPWTITVVGAGHVGRPLVRALIDAAFVAGAIDELDLSVIDFDLVGRRDGAKGYPSRYRDLFKVDALRDQVAREHGPAVAARVRPVVAAAQSVPGLLRQRTVFSAPDNNRSRAGVGERATSSLLLDLATGVSPNGGAIHQLGVYPPGTATPGDTFSARTWGDTQLHRCLTGAHVNSWAGADFPYGGVVSNLALGAWLAREGEDRPFFLSMTGARVERSEWQGPSSGTPELRELEGCSGESTLGDVAGAIARAQDLPAEQLVLRLEVPLVLRRCTNGPAWLGFERYPVTGLCPCCVGPWHLASSWAEWSPAGPLGVLSGLTLRQLHAPAGLGLQPVLGGPAPLFTVPFDWRDIPPLTLRMGPDAASGAARLEVSP